VIVVGAGAAGLEAARELRARRRSVIVLEARDRIGGRILTVEDARVPIPIELGAEFIHGEAPVTGELLARAGLSAMEIPTQYGGAKRGNLGRADFFSAIDRVFRHIDRRGPDESIGAFLARRPGGRALERERALVRGFVEGFHAADVDLVSARSLTPEPGHAPSEDVSRAGRVTRGYGSLVAWLAKDLRASIRLGCEVKAIAWRKGRVAVEARLASGRPLRCHARAAIVTAPVGVLQAPERARGSISFDPLPERIRHAVGGFEMGTVVRLVVWFREFPWNDATRRFEFVELSNGPFRVLWTARPYRWPLAVLWCGGPAAAALSRVPRAEVLRTMQNQLGHAFRMSPRRVKAAIRRVWWHDWDRDPYTRGAYSYSRVGEADSPRHLAKPEQNTLFFAGEATEPHGGTVEGALSSGRRAALQVSRALSRR